MPRPKAVIVVGLGEEGKLQAADLVHTVRQAVIAWAQRLAESSKPRRRLRAGRHAPWQRRHRRHGGRGRAADRAGRARSQRAAARRNVSDARPCLAARGPSAFHRAVSRSRDRSLARAAAAGGGDAAAVCRSIDDGAVAGSAPLQRPLDSGYRGADFDFITRRDAGGQDGDAVDLATRSTRSAPAARCARQRAQSQLLRELVATASNDQNRDQQIGRTLFNLLIPVELEAYLAGSGEMQIELDPQTAAIPWELLDTSGESTATRAVGDPRQAAAQAAHQRISRARRRCRRRRRARS